MMLRPLVDLLSALLLNAHLLDWLQSSKREEVFRHVESWTREEAAENTLLQNRSNLRQMYVFTFKFDCLLVCMKIWNCWILSHYSIRQIYVPWNFNRYLSASKFCNIFGWRKTHNMKKPYMNTGFVFQKYGKFWSVGLGNFIWSIIHKPLCLHFCPWLYPVSIMVEKNMKWPEISPVTFIQNFPPG